MNGKNWINFKELRAKLSFAHVFDFYGIKELKLKGGQLVGFCPIPNHGDRKTPSFSAHPEKGIFQCFGCGAKGNLLDFAVLMEGGNPGRGLDVRKAALKLHKLVAPLLSDRGHSEEKPAVQPVINPPLNFRLKNLDAGHPYLLERGFRRDVLEGFGVGFCCRGVLSGRIAIPLHDSNGTLIGYAGRVIDDSTITPQNPKYLFPGRREVAEEIVDFKKSLFLYNGYRINAPRRNLAIVEGFPSVWWLAQHGYQAAIALMGSSFSNEQFELLLSRVDPHGQIWIMTDGDKAGIRCGNELSGALASRRSCRFIYEPDRQPTDYTSDKLRRYLGEWRDEEES